MPMAYVMQVTRIVWGAPSKPRDESTHAGLTRSPGGYMKRTVNSPAPWFLARFAPEVYCRRDNRVYAHCPHAQRGHACPCLHGLETADSLFEPTAPDKDATP